MTNPDLTEEMIAAAIGGGEWRGEGGRMRRVVLAVLVLLALVAGYTMKRQP
jgi:hypothetical protein